MSRSPLGRRLVPALAAALVLAALTGCSSATVTQATDLGSSVASGVAAGVHDIGGGAVQKGMANVAGGIDGALSSALGGAGLTSDGAVPAGYPSSAVPLTDGTVLGGGTGPNRSGWVVQVRVTSLDEYAAAQAQLTAAGFTSGTSHTGASSAFGLFTSSSYRLVLTFTKNSDGVTATYIVTPR